MHSEAGSLAKTNTMELVDTGKQLLAVHMAVFIFGPFYLSFETNVFRVRKYAFGFRRIRDLNHGNHGSNANAIE